MGNESGNSRSRFEFLLSVWAILAGAIVGVLIGTQKQEWVEYIAPFGDLYLNVLKMCILPILITAISMSIGKLLKSHQHTHYIRRMFAVFAFGLVFTSGLGVLAGVSMEPGSNLSEESLSVLGKTIQGANQPDLEINLLEPFAPVEPPSLLKSFFVNLIPDNIFNALSNGSNLKVLFFAIIFGFAVGSIPKEASDSMLSFLDATYKAFAKLVSWLMYLLPFGLCGLIASNLSQVGIDILLAMFKFVPLVIGAFLILFIASSLVIGIRVGNFFLPFQALKQPVIISLGTANSLATLPSALEGMHKKLGYDKQAVDLLVPLAISLCRFGPVLYFATATLFVAQLYDIPLGFTGLLVVFVGAILAGMATAGTSGVVSLTMLGIVLTPLGLPFDAVIVLFIVVDPIVAPFRVLAIVHTACAAVSVIITDREKEATALPAEPAVSG
ncbi:MAG: dicarboxylate/amino acid:cation symporter [Pseudomonadales bacterium]|nr:dicarboxylate/amino acid:cation symporter [Pseudomonadales bacterium]